MYPTTVAVVPGCVALAALIAAWRFSVEAREVGVDVAAAEKERRSADLLRRVPIADVDGIDPTQIGVDPAEQDILPGGPVPEYIPRDVDNEVREAVEAALDGSGRWLVVVTGPSKVGKSRALLEAVTRCGVDRPLQLVVPADANALRASADWFVGSTDLPGFRVLWLDDLEPFLNEGVTLATLREWRSAADAAIVVGTYGGKGSERVRESTSGGLATIAAEVLQSAREITLTATTARELRPLHSRVSAEQFASLERHGLAAYLVTAPALSRKLSTRRHAPGDPECADGVAVVFAAADWARCGRTDPISHDILRQLWPSYLSPGAVATDDAFRDAIAWGVRPVAGTMALLHRTGGYHAFDYVVRLVGERSGAEPPRDAAWAAAMHGAADAQALAVAIAAYGEGGRLDG